MEPAKPEARQTTPPSQISGFQTVTKQQSSDADQGAATKTTIIDVESVDFHYGQSKALHGISLKIPEKQVTAFIGPSGCGKSTLFRCFNRMNDLIDHARVTAGEIRIKGVNIN